MIALVDYGVGNLFSLACSLRAVGAETVVTSDSGVLAEAQGLILPGVGAFGGAAELLRQKGLDEVILRETEKGKPLLGICLGMQLLFTESLEYGRYPGLGLIPGTVRPIREVIPPEYKIPHIGWNALRFPAGKPISPLFRHIQEGEYVYFVHSYHAAGCEPSVIATTEYGGILTAAAARGRVYGVQFHPEKSGRVGLAILRAFREEVETC